MQVDHHRAVNTLESIARYALVFSVFAYPFSKAMLLMGVYIGLVSWILYRLYQKQNPIQHSPLNIWIAVSMLALLFSIFASSEWHEGGRGLHKWLRGILLMWMCADLFRKETFAHQVSAAIMITLCVCGADGLYQYLTGRDFIHGFKVGYVSGDVKRVTSSLGYFGMFANFILMAFPVAVYSAMRQKNQTQRFVWLTLVVVLGITNLYLTRTRGAWISFALMMLCWLFISGRKQWLFVVLVFLCVVPFFLPKKLVFHHRTEQGIDQTIDHRFVLWDQALNVVRAKPLFGCGLNTYAKNMKHYNNQLTQDVKDYYAHNGYLQHAAETGIFGGAVLLGLIGSGIFHFVTALRFKRQRFEERIAVFLSFSGFLFYMFFDTIFHNLQPFIWFWLLMGWNVALWKESQNTTS